MIVTAWSNGAPTTTGAGYGLKVSELDRDEHFLREWETVVLDLEGAGTCEVTTNKPSFWNGTCRELISSEIGRWLLARGLAPWPPRRPPRLMLEPAGGARFRLRAPEDS